MADAPPGTLFDLYGRGAEPLGKGGSLLIVRPDGYVGYRGPLDAAPAHAYLDRRVAAAPQSLAASAPRHRHFMPGALRQGSSPNAPDAPAPRSPANLNDRWRPVGLST